MEGFTFQESRIVEQNRALSVIYDDKLLSGLAQGSENTILLVFDWKLYQFEAFLPAWNCICNAC